MKNFKKNINFKFKNFTTEANKTILPGIFIRQDGFTIFSESF